MAPEPLFQAGLAPMSDVGVGGALHVRRPASRAAPRSALALLAALLALAALPTAQAMAGAAAAGTGTTRVFRRPRVVVKFRAGRAAALSVDEHGVQYHGAVANTGADAYTVVDDSSAAAKAAQLSSLPSEWWWGVGRGVWGGGHARRPCSSAFTRWGRALV